MQWWEVREIGCRIASDEMRWVMHILVEDYDERAERDGGEAEECHGAFRASEAAVFRLELRCRLESEEACANRWSS